MRLAAAVLALFLTAAAPIEAERPCYGTYLRSPSKWHHRRFELSDYVVFTPRGWVRSHIYDHARFTHTYNYVFGTVVYSCPPCDDDSPLY